MIHHTLKEGTTTAGLYWLQTHRPDLFMGRNGLSRKPQRLIGLGLQGQPAIMDWLVAFDYLNVVRDGQMMAAYCKTQRRHKALAWVVRTYKAQVKESEWPDWFRVYL